MVDVVIAGDVVTRSFTFFFSCVFDVEDDAGDGSGVVVGACGPGVLCISMGAGSSCVLIFLVLASSDVGGVMTLLQVVGLNRGEMGLMMTNTARAIRMRRRRRRRRRNAVRS